ncbi:hypothetical protein EB796_007770 [Bugula neritina]|uniref:Uncharacterized protein n=1 Tax=Bugula neritina TaxID=10212 RepID=A0A7J7K5K6_BUGNE|nr:hypothetical protein EB796_007770 [Bugula neritina]
MLCFPWCASCGGLPSALDPVIETLQNLALPMAGSHRIIAGTYVDSLVVVCSHLVETCVLNIPLRIALDLRHVGSN